MRHTTLLSRSLLLVAVAAFVGCGAKNPASPSGAGGSATLAGMIVSAGTSTPAPAAMSGVVVSVPGTSLSAAVGAGNRFELPGVSQGDVTVRFSGTGVTGDVALSAVRAGESIDIAVSVAPSAVVLESERRSMGNEDQLEGRVESLPPTTAPATLVVAGVTVKTDGTTQFFKGGTAGTFADLAIGIRVHVKGHRDGTGLVASVIEIQNTNADIPVEINGIITAFSGPIGGFQLTVDGRLIKGDANTEFFGGSAFTNLAVGKRVEVKGAQKDGYVYATRIHVNDADDGDGDGQDESASIEGPLTSKSGAPPVMTLIVGGTTVHTSASTEVRRKGDVQTLSVLELGMTLHVVGVRKPDSSIDARMIQIKDDTVGSLFEIQGSMGGLKGTCPAVTFGVNGFSIVADGSTAFTPACSNFKSGDKVTVKGVVQSGGTVKATSVTK